MSPTSSGGSSRQSPDSLATNDKDNLFDNLHEETRTRSEKNEDRDIHNTFQFCTLPRKKKSSKGGK